MDHNAVARLRSRIADDDVGAAVATTIGASSTAGGFWRFFSEEYPHGGGIRAWNAGDWRSCWPALPEAFVFVGEDLLGNQLVAREGKLADDALIWQHENGKLYSLDLDLVTLLEAVIDSGVDWMDFYSDGSARVAMGAGLTVGDEQHLHWVTPLVLGGALSTSNLAVVERRLHLIGHGKLWAQVKDLPPGVEVVFKR